MTAPRIQSFFHSGTGTWTHVVDDGRDAVVIDPVLDYDHKSGRWSTQSADAVLAYLQQHALVLRRILETHAHADHLSAAQVLRAGAAVPVGIGAGIAQVQAHFAPLFGIDADSPQIADAFDETWREGDRIGVGTLEFDVMATPGHTPDSLAYRVGDHVFVGDTLFAPDVGTARCDFPGGSAAALHASIQRFYALPDATTLWLCHDYPPDGRAPQPSTTVGASRSGNRMLAAGDSLEDFSARRGARDATLPAPKLLYPALQVNIRGGRLPLADAHGRRHLLTPLTHAS